ncbi:MAG: ATP-binding cassette domain-containing protein [Planctomycetota bacterium]|nr:MAG: ATP-binding cassette domain-containing protein [Planctomycetota bacterium]
MSAAPLLELFEVSKRFGARAILDGVSLRLPAGARLTVAGVSGCGKTTLLRLIAGLDAPDGGQVLLGGAPASRGRRVLLPPWRRGVQMVFQDLALWPTRSVLQNVADALRAQGRSRPESDARAAAALARLGLGGLQRRRPHTLSGGEQRRLAFARALSLEPRVLLLDEPFASLDPVARGEGLAFLDEVLAATAAAVILVTHEPAEARALRGDLAVLRDGKLLPPRPCSDTCASDAAFAAALLG